MRGFVRCAPGWRAAARQNKTLMPTAVGLLLQVNIMGRWYKTPSGPLIAATTMPIKEYQTADQTRIAWLLGVLAFQGHAQGTIPAKEPSQATSHAPKSNINPETTPTPPSQSAPPTAR